MGIRSAAVLAGALALLAGAAQAQGMTGGIGSPSGGGVNRDYTGDTNVGVDGSGDYALAMQAVRQERWRDAKEALDRVIEYDSRNPKVWRLYGAIGMGRKDVKSAKRAYERAVKLDPANVDGHYGLALTLAALKDPKASEELAWLKERARTCGGRCPEAKILTEATTRLEAALAAPATGG